MKKLLFLLSALVVLSACGNNVEMRSEPTTVASTEPEPTATAKPSEVPTEVSTEALDVIKPYVNVRDVADKTPEEVAVILGEPVFTESFNFAMGPNRTEMPVTENYYTILLEDEKEAEVGRVEILFVDNGARWIRVNFKEDEYNKEDRSANLAYIGITPIELSENGPMSIYGKGVDGFNSVKVHDIGPGGSGTVVVVTQEAYE